MFSIASIILAVFTFVLLLVALLGTSNKYSLLQDVSFAEYTVDEDGTSVDLDIELGLGRVGYRSIRGTEVSSDTSQVCSHLRLIFFVVLVFACVLMLMHTDRIKG